MDEFKKIETYSNWCAVDRLDGRDIEDGEVLWIRFPDGKKRSIEVRVKEWKERISDMGTPYDLPNKRVYARAEVWGVWVELPLAGLEARRGK